MPSNSVYLWLAVLLALAFLLLIPTTSWVLGRRRIRRREAEAASRQTESLIALMKKEQAKKN